MAAVRLPAPARVSTTGATSISGGPATPFGAAAGGTNVRRVATIGASGRRPGDPGDGFDCGALNARGCGLGSATACGRLIRAEAAPTAGAAATDGAGPGARLDSGGGTKAFGCGLGRAPG